MKQTLLQFTAFALFSACCVNTEAKTEITRDPGASDTLTLNATEGYKTYQWQVSTDGKAFYSLPNETGKQLRTVPYAPNMYRVKATHSDGSVAYLDTTTINFRTFIVKKTSDISAAHGYVEVNGQPGGGISIPGEERVEGVPDLKRSLTNWNNIHAHAVYMMCSPSGPSSLSMLLTAKANTVVQFHLCVYNPNAPEKPLIDTYISIKGTGSEQEIPVYTFKTRSRYSYLRYDLQCLSGNENIDNINRWRFNTNSVEASYPPAFLSSPSVHLNGWKSTKAGAPTGSAYDWCYQEIMIPKISDYSGTYAMSLGVLAGYMGIQVNGSNHDVIFSMWDDGSTDVDPGLANYKKAGAVDVASYATAGRFGNEGTGVKTFVSGDWWKADQYVQFITNSRPEVRQYVIKDSHGNDSTITRQNSLVTAWFNPLDGNGWRYISTIRLSGSGHIFDSWYSFLENYNWPSGQVARKAYYRNGYAHAMSQNKWYHFNKVGFGHTDGGTKMGARNDYGQGRVKEQPNTFYMSSGGFTKTEQSEDNVALNALDTPIDTINIAKLLQRVDEAVAREDSIAKAAEELQASTYDKKGWKMLSFSSQEASGEGTNGRAAQIIDGDDATYWHSQWTGGGASFPHSFVIDMLKIQPVNGIQFTLSGGSTRHQKGIEIYGSKNNITWKKVYENKNCPDVEKYFLKMDSTAEMRYMKLVINTSQTGEIHTRINEINLMHPLVDDPTSILSPLAKANNSLSVYPSPATTQINVVAPINATDLFVTLYTSVGESVLSQHIYNQTAGEVTTIALPTLPKGVYVVKANASGNTYSRLILVK
ncbi:MAG: DUF3472 domain-containing protein [Bacteroidaceae bacterium]